MQYVQPIGGAPGDPYIDAEPGAGTEGSAVPAAAIEGPMRELVALIENAGLTPDGGDLGQVTGAVRSLIQKLSPAVAGAGGTANALTGTYVPAVTALTNGMTLSVRAGAANTTTNPTFAADGTAPKLIVKGNNLPLAAGDIAGAGFWAQLRYDAALDKWVLLNPATGVGVFATPAEAQAQAESNRAISPATLAAALQGGNQSLATAGYQKLPGGMIVQWGLYTGSNVADVTVTLPIAFPTAALAIFTSRGYTPGAGTIGYGVGISVGLTQAKFRNSDSGQGYFYLAIGY